MAGPSSGDGEVGAGGEGEDMADGGGNIGGGTGVEDGGGRAADLVTEIAAHGREAMEAEAREERWGCGGIRIGGVDLGAGEQCYHKELEDGGEWRRHASKGGMNFLWMPEPGCYY